VSEDLPPHSGRPAPKKIGSEETRLWLAALYGATMIAVQRLEFSVELIGFTQAAGVLVDKVWTRGMEVVEDLPDVEPPLSGYKSG
jgi:hypothetical protein